MDSADRTRAERALARAGRIVLHKGRVGDPELDFSPVRGADALSLVTRLSSEAHSLAGVEWVATTRADLPIRFVPRTEP
jgi:hypothetical protein